MQISSPGSTHSQRGSVAIIAAVSMVVILGFGALAIDVSYMRLAQAQCQDVADAASQTALFVMRRTGDTDLATEAAQNVIAKNVVAGKAPALYSIDYGDWDSQDKTFTSEPDTPNAVQVTVVRQDGDEVGLFLGRLFGQDSIPVAASSTSATRDLHVVLAMDITNSWSRPNYYYARSAAVQFYDVIANAYGPFDHIGMNVFTGAYSWEFTPLTLVDDAVGTNAIRNQWAAMETASKIGTQYTSSPLTGSGCTVKWSLGWSSPCFPDMPREYSDEPGTDHSVGMDMALQMFTGQADENAYRAVILLTDGYPNGIASTHGQKRVTEGYSESRWAEIIGPIPHTTASVKSDSVSKAQAMWDDEEIHTWVVSFKADAAFMDNMTQGDGYYTVTNDASTLVKIFDDIANSLPLAIVQ